VAGVHVVFGPACELPEYGQASLVCVRGTNVCLAQGRLLDCDVLRVYETPPGPLNQIQVAYVTPNPQTATFKLFISSVVNTKRLNTGFTWGCASATD
jgi:hypothetical protein